MLDPAVPFTDLRSAVAAFITWRLLRGLTSWWSRTNRPAAESFKSGSSKSGSRDAVKHYDGTAVVPVLCDDSSHRDECLCGGQARIRQKSFLIGEVAEDCRCPPATVCVIVSFRTA